jgi:hypothetical protein
MASSDENDRIEQEWYDRKSQLMEQSLGREHGMVMHAIIPYAIGGALDLYYFPNGLSGTAIATKELCELPTEGAANDVFDVYEMVMFTRHKIDLDAARDESSDFGKAHSTIKSILNCMARYSAEARLNPYETCEFPEKMERIGGRCLIFVDYAHHRDEVAGTFGLLGIIEIFRSEMDYARENGGAALIELLKTKGHYPFSDLDREPVT